MKVLLLTFEVEGFFKYLEFILLPLDSVGFSALLFLASFGDFDSDLLDFFVPNSDLLGFSSGWTFFLVNSFDVIMFPSK